MSKTAEECIALILEDIERRKTVEYGDKKSVRAYLPYKKENKQNWAVAGLRFSGGGAPVKCEFGDDTAFNLGFT